MRPIALAPVIGFLLAFAAHTTHAQPVSNQQLDEALNKAAHYLLELQAKDGSWPVTLAANRYPHLIAEQWPAFPTGPTALVTFALLEQGQTINNPKIQKALAYLLEHPTRRTYSLAMRTHVWAQALRQNPSGTARRGLGKSLARDTRQLINNLTDKGYPYPWSNHKYRLPPYTDNSNTQLGLFGVWAAGQIDEVEIPKAYWQKLLKHWIVTQRQDGGWGYVPEFNKPNMRPQERNSPAQFRSTVKLTLAGVASLYICMDNVLASRYVRCEGDQPLKPLVRGMEWLNSHFSASGPPNDCTGLFYLERVGLATGLRTIGEIDWFNTGSKRLLELQRGNGSFSGNIVDTSFGILFLVRGRQPLLFSKLQYPGDWRNRPRDLANLTRWLSGKLERTVRWQIISPTTDPAGWHDAPILVITGEKPVDFAPELIDKLRTFVHQGGTLLSIAECADRGFSVSMQNAYAQIFPQRELQTVPRTDLLYNLHYKLPGLPKLQQITNGLRPLALHCTKDLTKSWQLYSFATQKRHFELMMNLALLLTDRHLPDRGVGNWPQAAAKGDGGFLTPSEPAATTGPVLQRIRHTGRWNPEPLALQRWALWAGKHDQPARIGEPLPATQLPESKPALAVLTGTGPLRLPAEDLAALKQFLRNGGTLLIDAAGGSKDFASAGRKLLDDLVGPDNVSVAPADSFVYDQLGEPGLELRRQTRKRFNNTRPEIFLGTLDNRPTVILSTLDLTAGLLGLTAATLDGYAPETARRIVLGIVRHVAGNAPATIPDTPRQPATTDPPAAEADQLDPFADEDTPRKIQPAPKPDPLKKETEEKKEDDLDLDDIWKQME